jgi:hypothetical protein
MRNVHLITKHLYITSEEEPKDGEWVYNKYQKIIIKFSIGFGIGLCKKIILTTDPDLIADGVQAIDNEFLEWFVKNPSCERVEVDTYSKKIGVETDANGYREMDVFGKDYRIIIPQESTFINP